MSAKSDYKNKASANRKKVLIALNHGIASPIESGPMIKLFNQIHSDIESELNQIIMADNYASSGYRSQLEYRDKEAADKKEIDFGTGYRLHSPSGDCGVEMSETERALIACVSRNESVEAPLN